MEDVDGEPENRQPELTSDANPETLVETPSAADEDLATRRRRRAADREARRREYIRIGRQTQAAGEPLRVNEAAQTAEEPLWRADDDQRPSALRDDADDDFEEIDVEECAAMLAETRSDKALIEGWQQRVSSVKAMLLETQRMIELETAELEAEDRLSEDFADAMPR